MSRKNGLKRTDPGFYAKIGKKGGKAASRALSKEQRQARARKGGLKTAEILKAGKAALEAQGQ